MRIKLHYLDESLTDLELFKSVERHEIIHITTHWFLRKYIDPIIEIIPHLDDNNNTIWLEGQCKHNINFKYKQITFSLFIRILISKIADSLFDLIAYLVEHKYNNIINMIFKNSFFVCFFLLRALNIIKVEK